MQSGYAAKAQDAEVKAAMETNRGVMDVEKEKN